MYILMITPNKFPNGDAGAVRDAYFAKIYHSLGYDVVHIGMGKELFGTYNNTTYISMYKENNTLLKKVINIITYRKRLSNIYEKIVDKYGKPELIHIYDIPETGINFVKKQSKINNIPIIHDSVEWYSKCEFKYGELAYPYILKNRLNKKLITKPISVICISTYLENYFKEKGLNTIRIPVIMDSDEFKPKFIQKEKKINIVYAGSPAKKDFLQECVQGFELLPTKIRAKFVFHILGVDKEYVVSCLRHKQYPEELISYGRVPREKVLEVLADSDFSLLLRPENERYAKAGFPTKSVEAMMSGCAMVCNLSSDLGLYLINDYNSIIVNEPTSEAMKKALLKIAELSKEEIYNLKLHARETAEMNFDYRLYVTQLTKFIANNKTNS